MCIRDSAKANKGYKYLMTVIDAFSKFAYAVPLKTKTGIEVARALEPILSANKNEISTDRQRKRVLQQYLSLIHI